MNSEGRKPTQDIKLSSQLPPQRCEVEIMPEPPQQDTRASRLPRFRSSSNSFSDCDKRPALAQAASSVLMVTVSGFGPTVHMRR